MRRRGTSPVQQWIDSLPSPVKSTSTSLGAATLDDREPSVSLEPEVTANATPECSTPKHLQSSETDNPRPATSKMTISTPIIVPCSPSISTASRLARDPSFQSDSSHCSSVESLLELRRADPEAILLSLGFGGGASSPQDGGPLARIPKRFLQPSKLKGITIDEFVRHQQEANESLDSTSLGYRGLTGSPYVAPSEIVQKIMQRLREHESHELDVYLQANGCTEQCPSAAQPQQDPTRLSVLSPDNRQYLDRPRSKSPDMRNKRMIIGQRSFAFGRDGDLIELEPRSTQSSQESDDVFEYTCSEESSPVATAATTTVLKDDECAEKSTGCRRSELDSNGDSTETMVGQASVVDEPARRASEGSRRHQREEEDEGRRFSDSALQRRQRKRRSLRRQARIREDGPPEDEPRCVHCGRPERCELLEDEEEEEDATCCYRRSAPNRGCWREMERVLQKNKKLEDTVAKSRREMAEIRDMLSTVLSVRMEPGF